MVGDSRVCEIQFGTFVGVMGNICAIAEQGRAAKSAKSIPDTWRNFQKAVVVGAAQGKLRDLAKAWGIAAIVI